MDERDQYSLEKMKSVFAAAPCGVGIFAAGTREPLFLNNAYYRLVGYTPEEYRQLISNEDRKLFYPPDEHMSERVAQRYASDGCLAGVQYRVVQKDGGVCWVEGTFQRGGLVRVLHQGESIGVGLSNYSVPELKKIMGRKRHEVAAILGDAHYPEVIHRDNLLLDAAV